MWEVKIDKLLKDGVELCELTLTESKILDFMIRNPNKVISKKILAVEIKKSEGYIQNIMSRLTNSYSKVNLPIIVVKGIGWMWHESDLTN